MENTELFYKLVALVSVSAERFAVTAALPFPGAPVSRVVSAALRRRPFLFRPAHLFVRTPVLLRSSRRRDNHPGSVDILHR